MALSPPSICDESFASSSYPLYEESGSSTNESVVVWLLPEVCYRLYEESGSSTNERLIHVRILSVPLNESFYQDEQSVGYQSESIAMASLLDQLQENNHLPGQSSFDYHGHFSEFPFFARVLERSSVLFPEIAPQLLEKLESDEKIRDCFRRILNVVKRILLWMPEVANLRIENLADPEGKKLRVYFVATTNTSSRRDRKSLRKLIGQTIDRVVRGFIKSRNLTGHDYIQLRPIFGTIVEGSST